MAEARSLKTRDAVLFLIDEGRNRKGFGRTSLQKLVFFAALRLGRDLGHRAHYYGPFSDVVEAEVDALQLSGLIEEKVQNLGFTGPGGFLAKKYEYELTEAGKQRIQALRETHGTELAELSALVRDVEGVAGELEPRILAPAAKTLFIAKEERRSLSSGEISQLAAELGWELTDEQVQAVAGILERLGFLERA